MKIKLFQNHSKVKIIYNKLQTLKNIKIIYGKVNESIICLL